MMLKIMPQIGSQIYNKMGSELLKIIESICQENLLLTNCSSSMFFNLSPPKPRWVFL
jgi:hypothetical protein